jgi:hypothetical protein
MVVYYGPSVGKDEKGACYREAAVNLQKKENQIFIKILLRQFNNKENNRDG